MKRTLVSTILTAFAAILFFTSCKKDNSVATNPASATLTVNKLSLAKGDSVTITASNISNGTSTSTLFNWTITPATGGAVVTYFKDSIHVSFTNSGVYTITATLLDSLTRSTLVTTNSVNVTVTTASVNPIVAVQTGDVLNLKPVVNTSDSGGIFLVATSTLLYPYSNYVFSYNASLTSNQYSLNIGGVAFPTGVAGVNTSGVATSKFYMGNLAAGTYPISITWLGKVYTGSLTVTGAGSAYTFTWDNTTSVKILPLTVNR